jgi:tRNA-Thr(GGU) m(6)t(6)A37 methyltransferase TsaA
MKNRGLKRKAIKLHPLGIASRTEKELIVRITIYPEYADGLDGIENLDHIYVLYWMHKLKARDRETVKVHPQGDLNKPLRGVFSMRSPMRPNPIGLTRVRLLKKEGNTLLVEGLDALDGSPVIDIKSG